MLIFKVAFLYLTLPVSNLQYGCWIHHNVYSGMEYAMYSIIKSPLILVFNLSYGSQEHIVSQDIEHPYMYSTLASY